MAEQHYNTINKRKYQFLTTLSRMLKICLASAELIPTLMNPYSSTWGSRSAVHALQQQSYQNAGLMQTAPQLQDATAMAGMAGLGALNTQYTFRHAFRLYFQRLRRYMQSLHAKCGGAPATGCTRVKRHCRQAQQAQAARSGAFGGSGDYLMRGQAAGNLARQKGDIQAKVATTLTTSNAAVQHAVPTRTHSSNSLARGLDFKVCKQP
jgi:hypothetical protein